MLLLWLQDVQMGLKDERLKSTGEVLRGIKVRRQSEMGSAERHQGEEPIRYGEVLRGIKVSSQSEQLRRRLQFYPSPSRFFVPLSSCPCSCRPPTLTPPDVNGL